MTQYYRLLWVFEAWKLGDLLTVVVPKRVVEGGKVKGAIEIASRFVVEKVRGGGGGCG